MKTFVRSYRGEIKWATSRARDTYGENVCTLYIDGVKVARCGGGGYDMIDSVLASWLNATYGKRMAAYCKGKVKEPAGCWTKIAEQWKDGHFFGDGSGKWFLDGGNGCSVFSAGKIGVTIRQIMIYSGKRGCRGSGIYEITDKKAAIE